MPPYTRSRRIDGFSSDTLITRGHLSRATSYRTGINLDKHGVLLEIKIKRPNVYETECAVRIPMPTGSKNIHAVTAALRAGVPVAVYVLDTLKNRVFHRGPFVVTACTRTHFTVFKQWEPDKKVKTIGEGTKTAARGAPEHLDTEAAPEHPDTEAAPEHPDTEGAPEHPDTEAAPEHLDTEAAPEHPDTEETEGAGHHHAAEVHPPIVCEHVETVGSGTTEAVATRRVTFHPNSRASSSSPGTKTPADDFFFLSPAKHDSRGRCVTTKEMKNRFAAFARPALQSRVYPPCAVTVPPPVVPRPNSTLAVAALSSSSSLSAGNLVEPPKARKYFTPRTFSTPTVFQGITYRSRLESRLAHLMSELKVRFVYEPMRYTLPSGSTYMIDFFLPDQQLYVELKPKRPHIEEEFKCEQMSRHGFRVTLLYGWALHKPPFRSETAGKVMRDYDHHNALRGMTWINGVKLPGDTVFVVGRHASLCTPLDVVDVQQPHLNQPADTLDTRWAHPLILTAMSKMDVV